MKPAILIYIVLLFSTASIQAAPLLDQGTIRYAHSEDEWDQKYEEEQKRLEAEREAQEIMAAEEEARLIAEKEEQIREIEEQQKLLEDALTLRRNSLISIVATVVGAIFMVLIGLGLLLYFLLIKPQRQKKRQAMED